MTFTASAAGFDGSFGSSQLRAVGIPLSRVTYTAPTLRWELVGDETTAVFEGTLRGDSLAGRVREGAAAGTFHLTRATPRAAPVREQDVTFANGTVTLAGTIVLPGGPGPFPGIVYLHGSGPEGRWASRYLAQEFARRGVAALIYDKRGVGRSTGDWREVGFAELVGDAAAAIQALRAHPQVDSSRVGIHGHSQGGTIAPWVAATDRRVAFVVASAGSGIPVRETEIYSVENGLGVRGMAPADQDLARRFVQAIVATAFDGAPRAELDRVWEQVRDRPWAFELPPPTNYYWAFSRRIASYDALSYWRQVTAPVLLLFGELDERVPSRPSAVRIAEAYLAAGGPRLDVHIFPLGDHTFRMRPPAAGGFAWPRDVPGYPDRLLDWVLEVTRR
jgi:dipeptidyl aminopeptidase/acylaminoacyl peptidase